jgi:acetyl esterase
MSTDWPDLDPELRLWIDETATAPAGSSIPVLREISRRNNGIAFSRTPSSLITHAVIDEQFDGPEGPVAVRILSPGAGSDVVKDTPLIVFFHGGGWTLGDLDTHLAATHRLCKEAGAVVVAVDYRRSPEHRFPAAFDDCLAAAEWAFGHCGRLGVDPRHFVVAGDSSGAQLAASVAIARRDAGDPLAAQLLLYPVTSAVGGYADPDANASFPSRSEFATGPVVTLASMAYFVGSYTDLADTTDWRISPMCADLQGVAPAVIHLAGIDVLRDEGSRYAEALGSAGVQIARREFPSLNHGYFGLGGVSKAADKAASMAARDLRQMLALL